MISRLSLTARLTLLFTMGSGAVLLALGWLVGVAIERHFEELDRAELTGKLQHAQHLIAQVGTPAQLERLAVPLGEAFLAHHDLVVRVMGPDQQVLLATPGAQWPTPWPVAAADLASAPLWTWTQDGRNYRGLAATFPTAMASQVQVAMAIDSGHHDAFLRTLQRSLWLFVACAVLFMGLLGWFAARRGLAPLRAMREQAAAVTAHSLDRRLPAQAVPAELADLAATLNEMLERLEEAFRRLSDFSSDLAHELRTPISNLMMQTQVALSRPRDADSYRAILESNAEEFERLARMIADMLFLAKAENGLTIVHGEPVDLAREVRDLFDFYEALADERRIALTLTGEGVVQGDRLMLRRALNNLLSNALRHTPPGGRVSVAIVRQEGQVLLRVENTGDTIPARHLARLFERFYRADPSRQHASGEGTGLGLAITQAILRAHLREVTAASDGGLTVFTLRFPF